MKKANTFYALLNKQTDVMLEAVQALCVYCDDPAEANGSRVKELENKGDDVRRQIVNEINRSFITPIAREDLYRLSGIIDDVTDYAWSTVKELGIYDIKPDTAVAEMSAMLLEMARSLAQSINHLANQQGAKAGEEAVMVKKQENALNARFHQAVNDLYESTDYKKILKYREVYAHLNHASDKGDVAADMLLDILVKA